MADLEHSEVARKASVPSRTISHSQPDITHQAPRHRFSWSKWIGNKLLSRGDQYEIGSSQDGEGHENDNDTTSSIQALDEYGPTFPPVQSQHEEDCQPDGVSSTVEQNHNNGPHSVTEMRSNGHEPSSPPRTILEHTIDDFDSIDEHEKFLAGREDESDIYALIPPVYRMRDRARSDTHKKAEKIRRSRAEREGRAYVPAEGTLLSQILTEREKCLLLEKEEFEALQIRGQRRQAHFALNRVAAPARPHDDEESFDSPDALRLKYLETIINIKLMPAIVLLRTSDDAISISDASKYAAAALEFAREENAGPALEGKCAFYIAYAQYQLGMEPSELNNGYAWVGEKWLQRAVEALGVYPEGEWAALWMQHLDDLWKGKATPSPGAGIEPRKANILGTVRAEPGGGEVSSAEPVEHSVAASAPLPGIIESVASLFLIAGKSEQDVGNRRWSLIPSLNRHAGVQRIPSDAPTQVSGAVGNTRITHTTPAKQRMQLSISDDGEGPGHEVGKSIERTTPARQRMQLGVSDDGSAHRNAAQQFDSDPFSKTTQRQARKLASPGFAPPSAPANLPSTQPAGASDPNQKEWSRERFDTAIEYCESPESTGDAIHTWPNSGHPYPGAGQPTRESGANMARAVSMRDIPSRPSALRSSLSIAIEEGKAQLNGDSSWFRTTDSHPSAIVEPLRTTPQDNQNAQEKEDVNFKTTQSHLSAMVEPLRTTPTTSQQRPDVASRISDYLPPSPGHVQPSCAGESSGEQSGPPSPTNVSESFEDETLYTRRRKRSSVVNFLSTIATARSMSGRSELALAEEGASPVTPEAKTGGEAV